MVVQLEERSETLGRAAQANASVGCGTARWEKDAGVAVAVRPHRQPSGSFTCAGTRVQAGHGNGDYWQCGITTPGGLQLYRFLCSIWGTSG
eukprot:445872-Karenia_brevis.AAC.1